MGRLKAAIYDLQMRLTGERLAGLRRGVVGAASGRVLEFGVGTGQNLPFYQPGARVVAIDPDLAMLQRAQPRAAESAADVDLVAAGGERLPFADGVFDEVIATLVFCTVGSPALSLGEIRRVLKPGGRLRFMEHVRSADPRWATLQDLVTPLWRAVTDG